MIVPTERLRDLLHRAADETGETGEWDQVDEPVAIEQASVTAGDGELSGGSVKLPIDLLALSRDGDATARIAGLDAVGATTAQGWLGIDEGVRNGWWWARRWTRSIAMSLADGDLDTCRLVAAGCHYDGRIREAAVLRLADREHPAAMAVLALRSCDWVAEVRQAARAAVAARPSPGGPALLMLAELAFALQPRREGAWLADRVDVMLRELSAQGLKPLLSAQDRQVRRAAHQAAIDAGYLDQQWLAWAAVRDHDVVIRAMCARVTAAAADPAQSRALLTSHTVLVRAEALQALSARGDREVVESALTDRHPLVREIAQAVVRRHGSDPADRYRELSAQVPPLPSVIAGLGETGGPDDADVVMRWLSHPRSRGRVEAIRALRRLNVTPPAALVPLLHDESAVVTRQAVKTLQRNVTALDPAELWNLLGEANPSHVRFAGYRLLTGGDAWQRLVVNLRLVEDQDQRLRVSSRADLATWVDRTAATTYRGLSPDLAAELDHLIERARPSLGEYRIRLLRIHVGLDTTSRRGRRRQRRQAGR